MFEVSIVVSRRKLMKNCNLIWKSKKEQIKLALASLDEDAEVLYAATAVKIANYMPPAMDGLYHYSGNATYEKQVEACVPVATKAATGTCSSKQIREEGNRNGTTSSENKTGATLEVPMKYSIDA